MNFGKALDLTQNSKEEPIRDKDLDNISAHQREPTMGDVDAFLKFKE